MCRAWFFLCGENTVNDFCFINVYTICMRKIVVYVHIMTIIIEWANRNQCDDESFSRGKYRQVINT
jgi:hypothetical protein